MSTKRRAEVVTELLLLGEQVSKADLLEAAFHLAALAHDRGVDDHDATLERLREELNTIRAFQGRGAVRGSISPTEETPASSRRPGPRKKAVPTKARRSSARKAAA